MTTTIASHYQRAKSKATTALDHLGDTIYRHGFLLEFAALLHAYASSLNLLLNAHATPLNTLNLRPPSRASSATACSRPAYRNPPRSKMARSIFLAAARRASTTPTARP